MIAAARASGVILFARKCPRDALPITRGESRKLRRIVGQLARRAYDSHTLLVPGLPEAANWEQRSEALVRFQARIDKELGRPGLARRIAEFDKRRRRRGA